MRLSGSSSANKTAGRDRPRSCENCVVMGHEKMPQNPRPTYRAYPGFDARACSFVLAEPNPSAIRSLRP